MDKGPISPEAIQGTEDLTDEELTVLVARCDRVVNRLLKKRFSSKRGKQPVNGVVTISAAELAKREGEPRAATPRFLRALAERYRAVGWDAQVGGPPLFVAFAMR